MSQLKTKGFIVLLVSSLLLGVTSTVWASQPATPSREAARRHALRGEIVAIDGNTLTVNTRLGEITLLTDDETRFHVPGQDEATVADVQTGDRIAALGRREEAGVFHARWVLVAPGRAKIWRGTVGRVLDHVVSLIVGDEEIAMLTNENTRLFIPGIAEPKLKDLENGVLVTLAGLQDDDGNWVARAIRVVPDQRPRLAGGEVLGVEVEGFLLNTRRGEKFIHVDDQTRFWLPGVEEPGLDDLTPGARAIVGGVKDQDGTLLAWMVWALPEQSYHRQRGTIREEISPRELLARIIGAPALRTNALPGGTPSP